MLKSAPKMPIRGGRSRRNSNNDEIFSRETSPQNEHAKDGADIVEVLPLDVLNCIMCCVASISLQAYRSCMQTCRTFNMLSKTKDVLQNINFDDFTYWNPEWMDYHGGYQFYRRLIKNENPWAFFHLGLRQFCNRCQFDEGITNLEKSSRLGYHVATYALGLIRLGGSATRAGKEEGISLISEAKRYPGFDVHKCRSILRHQCRSRRGYPDFIYHESYPLKYTTKDHSDTCVELSNRYFLSYGVEESEMAKCRACEMILESRQFRIWFGGRIAFPIID